MTNKLFLAIIPLTAQLIKNQTAGSQTGTP
jgi:hypothetical protein